MSHTSVQNCIQPSDRPSLLSLLLGSSISRMASSMMTCLPAVCIWTNGESDNTCYLGPLSKLACYCNSTVHWTLVYSSILHTTHHPAVNVGASCTADTANAARTAHPKLLVDAMTGDSYTVCKPSLGPCTWRGAAPVASTWGFRQTHLRGCSSGQ